MAVNKVVRSDGTTLIDLTSDTVTSANHIMEGYVGHLADGTSVEGTGTISASQQASLDALVRYSNEITGENDADISEAVTTLINNFRKGDSSSVFWKTVIIQEDHTTYGTDCGVVYWKEYLEIPDEDLQDGYIFFCDVLNNNDASGWGKWMSGFYHALDGNIGCLFYRNSYDSTPVFIYDNEYAFFATTGTIVNIYRFRLDPNEGKSFWVKPREWPDIESIDIPDDLDYDVRYLLYDKSCGYDEVHFQGRKMDVYKGTVSDGVFTGEQVATNVTSFTDTLVDRFTVYKVVGGSNFGLYDGLANGYTVSMQGLVWKYGKIPQTSDIGSSREAGAPWANHTQRVKLLNGVKLLYLTFPSDLMFSLKSLEVGVKENGDFEGRIETNGITRVGNGIMFYQHVDNKEPLIVKNLKFGIGSGGTGRFCQVNNITFKNVDMTFPQTNFQNNSQLRSVKFINSRVACTSMYYQFSNCKIMTDCDLSEVDFSECTNSGNAFAQCRSLKHLKLNDTWKMDLDLSSCNNLTKESIIGIFQDLPTIEETKTIKIPYGLSNYLLTEEDKAIITDKGWTIA